MNENLFKFVDDIFKMEEMDSETGNLNSSGSSQDSFSSSDRVAAITANISRAVSDAEKANTDQPRQKETKNGSSMSNKIKKAKITKKQNIRKIERRFPTKHTRSPRTKALLNCLIDRHETEVLLTI